MRYFNDKAEDPGSLKACFELVTKPDLKIQQSLFSYFSDTVGELPLVHRSEIFSICQPRTYDLLERITTPEMEKSDVFMICRG